MYLISLNFKILTWAFFHTEPDVLSIKILEYAHVISRTDWKLESQGLEFHLKDKIHFDQFNSQIEEPVVL